MQQIPDLITLWINSNPSQRAWLGIVAVISAVGGLLIAFQACATMLCAHMEIQWQRPWDAHNFSEILKYTLALVALSATSYTLWKASYALMRSLLNGLVMTVKMFCMVSRAVLIVL